MDLNLGPKQVPIFGSVIQCIFDPCNCVKFHAFTPLCTMLMTFGTSRLHYYTFWTLNTLREETSANNPIILPFSVQLGRIYFDDLIKFLNLARINFGKRPFFVQNFNWKVRKSTKKGLLGEIETKLKEFTLANDL